MAPLLLRLLLTLALLTAPLQHASAAECTSAQLMAMRAFDTNATEVCGTSLLSFAALSAICGKPTCLAYVMSLGPQLPYCDIQGVNVRAIFGSANSFCALQSNETDAVSFTRTPSNSGSASVTTGTSGIAVALIALAATLVLATAALQ